METKTNITFLDSLFRDKKILNTESKSIDFHSGINIEEAVKLIEVIEKFKPINTLEIGLAMGTSAICFLHSKLKYISSGIHIAIDPNQYTDYEGAGVKIINDNGISNNFQLFEGKTHEVFYQIQDQNIQIDMAFIDGWHTFDYTLIDFFFIDQLLKEGGIIAFHDMYGLAKIKVLKFILTHRDYRIMTEHIISEKNKVKIFKFLCWRILRSPRLVFSKYFWKFQIASPYGLIFIQKKSSWEPNYDFYKYF